MCIRDRREAEWCGWLAEYDRRGGFASWGCVSAAQWLMWRCGLGAGAARERVRVARVLMELPLIAAEFRAGRLSWSKVRAVTRVADSSNEADLVEVAVVATGSQLELICRGLRRAGNYDGEQVNAATAFALRSWSKRVNYDGTSTYVLRVVDDEAKAIDRQIEAQVDAVIDDAVAESADRLGEEPTRREAIKEGGGLAAVRADAAAAILTGAAQGQVVPVDVTMVIDAEHHPVEEEPGEPDSASVGDATQNVPAGTPGTPELPSNGGFEVLIDGARVTGPVARRLCCDPRVTALVESAKDGPLGVGRTQRFVTAKLRRALDRRDGGCCQFPGCTATKRLHAHHIVHWVDGGPTELINLILLCHFHHHVVHDAGWNIDPTTRAFIAPDKGAVSSHPAMANADIADMLTDLVWTCLLYTSPSPRDATLSRMPSSA